MSIAGIVVGFDGSEPSHRALAMAVGLAVRERGDVHACFVVHAATSVALGGFFTPFTPVSGADAEASELGRLVREELDRAGVRGEFTWRGGDVALALERLARDYRADLIVVGRSSHPHLHLGGVPRQLLARGRHPVLVVP